MRVLDLFVCLTRGVRARERHDASGRVSEQQEDRRGVSLVTARCWAAGRLRRGALVPKMIMSRWCALRPVRPCRWECPQSSFG